MPLPAPLTGLTIRAKLLNVDSTPVVGATITLTPTVTALSPSGDVLLTATALAKTTASDGTAEWTDVLATDSPGLSNRVPYRVAITSGTTTLVAPYIVELLSTAAVGGVLRLDDVAPATAPVTLATYVLSAQVGAVGGPAGPLDANGQVPAAQLPAAGGSIASTIVDAKGDLITATAADTPARLAVGADGTVLKASSAAATGLAWAALATSDVTGLDTALAGKLAASTVTTAGDLIAGTGAGTVTRVGIGADGTVPMADSSVAGKVRWATRTAPAYDLQMDGLVAAAADPLIFRSQSQLGAAGIAVRMLVPAGRTITGTLTLISTAGTLGAGGVNGFAINDDAGALVTSTVDDNNLWTTTGLVSKAFPTPVAAQTADRYVYVCLRVTGYTSGGPWLAYIDGPTGSVRLDGLMSGKRRAMLLSGSAWGAINPATGPSTGGYMAFLALY